MARINMYETPRRPRGALLRSMAIMIAVLVVVIGIVGWLKFNQIQKFGAMKTSMADPAQTVSATTAGATDWQSTLTAVGSLRAVNGVDLSFENAGIVDQIHFKDGQDVQAGQVLITQRLNDEPGRLTALQAQEKLAEITLERDQRQFKEQAVAQATIDADTANLQNFKAQLNQIQAQIDERVIKAPFSGHLGARQVDLGQYLAAGTTVVTLQSLDPIYVDFFLPQQALQELKTGVPVTAYVDTYPGETFEGTVTVITPRVDPQTRNIQVRATIRNPQHRLLPGMYATVSVNSGAPQHLVTVPQTAITYNPYGNTVFTVSEETDDSGKKVMRAHQTFVTTGATRGDQVAVSKGLDPGTLIVTSGQMKLRNGSRVIVNNAVQPTDNPNPTPQEQ
jgi:membrane fusion protein (multidrug efflux system)